MFQKLYRHLEDINSSLKKEKPDFTDEQLANRITEKLDAVNASILEQNRVKTSRSLPIFNSILSIAGVVVVLILSYYTFHLARVTDKLANSPIQSQPAPQLPERSAALISADNKKEDVLQQHLARLDSLIAEQSQSLKELKKLNAVAVANFSNLRKHFAQVDSMAAIHPRIVDSLSAAR